MFPKFCTFWLLLVLAVPAQSAGLYRCTGEDGRVTYSDVVCNEAPEEVKLDNVGEDQPTATHPALTGNLEVDVRRMGFTNRDHYRMALHNCKSFTPGTDSWNNANCDKAFALSRPQAPTARAVDLITLPQGQQAALDGFQRIPTGPQSGIEELWYQETSNRLITKIGGAYREHCHVDKSILAGLVLDPDLKGYYERNIANLPGDCS